VEICGRDIAGKFSLKIPDFHVAFRDLLHAVNLRHGTHSFTSIPKEGVLRIFSPWKIRRLRPGFNPRTWVLKASTLPLDHRSRLVGMLGNRFSSQPITTGIFVSNIYIYIYMLHYTRRLTSCSRDPTTSRVMVELLHYVYVWNSRYWNRSVADSRRKCE
jgi:hypothetical protein